MTTATRDDSGTAPTRVTDLRGRSPATADPILVDPTGRRARRLRLGGRMLAAVFSMWLCALVLAGLGAFPVDLPLSGAVGAGHPPPTVRSAPDPRSSYVTVAPRRVSAGRPAQADSRFRQSRTTAPGTNRSSSAGRQSVARTPDARTRHVSKHGPRSVTSSSGSRRVKPAGGAPAETPAPASSPRSPSGSSGGASASAPGHRIGSTGSSGASASAPGHQNGAGGSPSSAPATPTTASPGRGASGSASDHAAGRTTGSGTPPD
jgi:hypothetical protein